MRPAGGVTQRPSQDSLRTGPLGAPSAPSSERPRFLSEADCHDIAQRLARVAQGGGYTVVAIRSWWTGNVRWARNQISTAGEISDNAMQVERNLNGAWGTVQINDTTDVALIAAARRAERLAALLPEESQSDLVTRLPLEPAADPKLFSEATYALNADRRAATAIALAKSAADAGMLSAGYIEVSAHSMALIDSYGRARYFQYTVAQYSVTVRDPKGTGSGWAGVDWYDWTKIDGAKLSQLALDKCLQSRNPVAIEPGRYTTILEPQAVCDFIGNLVFDWQEPLARSGNEYADHAGPFLKTPPHDGLPGFSMLGERVVDDRITISADPMDPDLGFPPFQGPLGGWTDRFDKDVYHPATWIERGVLTNLAYDRHYGIAQLGLNTGLPNSGAFRMSVQGKMTDPGEMIATTKRGLLVTRFDQVLNLNFRSLLYRGYTRDGLWLIENGKISKPVRNMAFTESILFALNNVEQLGVPQRVFHPQSDNVWGMPRPVIVPPLKIKDFSFTALVDSI